MMDRERDEAERDRSEATQPTTPETPKKAAAKNANKRRSPMASAAAAASQNEHSSTASTATVSSLSEAAQPTTPQEGRKNDAKNGNKRRLPMAAAAAAASRNESSSTVSTAAATAATSSPLPPLPHSFATMKVMNFPRKLYEIVKYTTEIGNNQSQRQKYLDYSKILSWHPDPMYDSTFVVWDKDAFMAHVAPRFFPTQNAFRSLERLLNMWCFTRVPEEEQRLAGLPQYATLQGKNIRVFCHGDFSRSDASRIKNIERRNLATKRNATTLPAVASVPRGFQNSIHNTNFPLSPQSSLIPILPKPTASQSVPSGQAPAAFATVAASTMALGVGPAMQQSFPQHGLQSPTFNTGRQQQQQMQPPPSRPPPPTAMAAHQVPPSNRTKNSVAPPTFGQQRPLPKRPRLGNFSAGRAGSGGCGNEATTSMSTTAASTVDDNPTGAPGELTFQDDGNDSPAAWSTPGRASRPVATRGNDQETVLGSLLQPNYAPPPPHPQRRQTSGQFDDADEEEDGDDHGEAEDEMEDDDDTLIF